MALRASDREDSFDVDVEGARYRKDSLDGLDSLTAGQDAGSDEEESRFLPAGADPNIDSGPSKVTQRYVLLMCVMFLFIGEFASFIMEPPLQQIMEDFVCHAQYPDHAMGATQEADDRCKNANVQGTLAMARTWMMWVSMLVPLFVQIPYGIAADKYGRRPVLFLGLCGMTLMTVWNIIVLRRPDTFSIWHLVYGPIPTILGGGMPVIVAMIWTIIADCTPSNKRTALFYQLHAMMLILSAVFRPLAAWMMSIDPWFPMWVGMGALVLSTISTLLIPETLHFSEANEKHRQAQGERLQHPKEEEPSYLKQGSMLKTWLATRKEFSNIWRIIFSSKMMTLLMAAYGLCDPIYTAFEMNLLQYVTNRFGWDWSTAAYWTTVNKVTCVIVLLVLLPLLSRALTKRLGLDTLTRDVYLARGSIVCLAAGNILTAFAAAPWLLVTALIVLSLGNGFWPQMRAILIETVEPHNVATLNTIMSTVETVMDLITVPPLGWLLSKGIEIGGLWMGLPYIMTTVLVILATIAMFAVKVLRKTAQTDRGYELLHQAQT